jgi:hypothetical protein
MDYDMAPQAELVRSSRYGCPVRAVAHDMKLKVGVATHKCRHGIDYQLCPLVRDEPPDADDALVPASLLR